MYGSSGPPQPSPAQSRAISASWSGAVLKPGMEKFCCLAGEPVPVFELPHSAFYFWIIWSQNFPCCNFCSLHRVQRLWVHPFYLHKAAEAAGRSLKSHPTFLWDEEALSASSGCFLCSCSPAHQPQLTVMCRPVLLQVQGSHLIGFLPAHCFSLHRSLCTAALPISLLTTLPSFLSPASS